MTDELKQPRPRAVFSPEDYELIKEAVGDFARRLPEDDPRVSKLARLHHRLGRLD